MADIYVNLTSGSDSTGDGSSGNPYKTIGKAETEATLGDTCILADGTHTLTANASNTITNLTTIKSASNDPTACIIDGTLANYYYISLGISSGTTCTIRGITWKNFGIPIPALISVDNSTMTIENCRFVNPDSLISNRVYVGGGTTSGTFTIDRCVFNGFAGSNTFGRSMIGFNRTSTAAYAITIQNSLFYIDSLDAAPNSYGAIQLGTDSTTCTGTVVIKNNIFYNDNNLGSFVTVSTNASTALSITYTNSCEYVAGGGSIGASNVTLANGITSDPLFVNLVSDDYRLRPGSPCINAGIL